MFSFNKMYALLPGDIILISGYKRHGKNTFSRFIMKDETLSNSIEFTIPPFSISLFQNSYPRDTFNEVSFAGYLKTLAARNLEKSVEWIEDNKDNSISQNNTCTVREYLIQLASKKRDKNNDYFAEKINIFPDKINIITDFRFPNEYVYLREKYPNSRIFTVRVIRLGENTPEIGDLSERSLDNCIFDMIVSSIKI